MWLDQNGIWWVAKAWPELNHCVDYDFLFTGYSIFRPCVFEAEAVFYSFSSFLVFQSAHRTPGQTANSEADKHTRMIIITYNSGHAYLLLSFFSFLFCRLIAQMMKSYVTVSMCVRVFQNNKNHPFGLGLRHPQEN